MTDPVPAANPFRRRSLVVGSVAAVVLVALLGVAAFPYGVLRGTIAARLSARIGRPVTIDAVERLDRFGFTPTVAVRGVTIPQAPWAGPGELARIDTATVRFPVWPLLTGRIVPQAIAIAGARLNLVRDATGRTNWSRDEHGRRGDGNRPDLGTMTVRDLTVSYRDARRQRAFMVAVTADRRTGMRAHGTGAVRGAPVRVAFAAPPVAPGPWPFAARIAGTLLTIRASGTMDRPLDTGHMTLMVSARADDLRYIDAIIEAGLFGSPPVALTATVRHDGPVWSVPRLAGTIGRSDFAGQVTVDKSSGRNVITGAVRSRQLDFGDLSSDEGRARGAAQEARIGLRVVPDTRIDLTSVRNTDGRIDFRAASIVSRKGPSAIRWLSGTLRVDRQLLTADPLAIGLRQGAIRGRATIDQRGGRPVPLVTIDLRLRNATLGALEQSATDLGGRTDAVAHLVGRGATIRAAVGASDGRIGLAANGGQVPVRYAAALGFDAGRALLADRAAKTGLRCVVADVTVRGGRGRVAPLVIDTASSQAKGAGTLSFPDETLAIRLTGAPKRGAVLRVPGEVLIGGRLRAPTIAPSAATRSTGNILKAIGHAVFGGGGPHASDADCAALTRQALR